MLSIVYNISTVSSADDPTVTTLNRFNELFVEYTSPGKYLIEFFPWMLYIPASFAKWKREAREARHYFTKLFEGMVQDVQHRIVRFYLASSPQLLTHTLQDQGDERPSFAGTLLRERDRNNLSDLELTWLPATM